jgi:hypothetical protein
MKTNLVAVLLVLITFCDHIQAQTTPAVDADSIADALSKVREVKVESYHRYLREASLIFPPACKGPFDDVNAAIEKLACPIVESWDNGDIMHRYYLAQKKIVSFDNGGSLDAYIHLSARNQDRSQRTFRPGNVFEVAIMLADEINADYEDVIKQGRYPEGSVLDVVMHAEEVRKEGSRWPILKKVLVNYGTALVRPPIGSYRGFDVSVEFTASNEQNIGGKKVYLFVASGLDPPKDGKRESRRVKPQDILGPARGFGANEWWHGTPDEVEANQKKYLKAQR